MKKIGVLALQGAFIEHIAMLNQLGVEALPVRLRQELEGLEGLIIPGGESTAIGKLMASYNLLEPLRSLARDGFALLGTCAGMVLLSKRVLHPGLEPLRVIDIEVRRNAFGRQIDSFETNLVVPVLGEAPFPAIFIRAPIVEKVGWGVEVLARIPDGTAVAARQGKVLVCAFHPELTADFRFHRYFLDIVAGIT